MLQMFTLIHHFWYHDLDSSYLNPGNKLEAWIPQVLCIAKVYSSSILQKVPLEKSWRHLNFGLRSERVHQQLFPVGKWVLAVLVIPQYSAFSDAGVVCPDYMDKVKLLARCASRKKFFPGSDLQRPLLPWLLFFKFSSVVWFSCDPP